MRILQLSDPHLLADPEGHCRGRRSLVRLREGLQLLLERLDAAGTPPDRLLLSGDLCHDESWQGYARLRDLLRRCGSPVALLPGNHDDPALLRAALGREALLAPQALELGEWHLLLLDSHRAGRVGGRLGEAQRRWIARELGRCRGPALVAVHHPPVAIGDPGLDAIALEDGAALMALLRQAPVPVTVVFGHIHQHWQQQPGGGPLLIGCPSTLSQFAAVQPCPLGRPDDPGGRWLRLGPGGDLRHQLLRWSAVPSP